MSTVWGDVLVGAARECSGDVLLVAPFIKYHTLCRIAGALPANAALTVVTRWRAEEIAAGVSDLEVFDLLAARPGSRLLLCHELHGKLYRFGSRVLIGSANLTDAALGWSRAPNLEVLVETDEKTAVDAFERELFDRAVPALAAIRNALATVAVFLQRSVATESAAIEGEIVTPTQSNIPWLPRMRSPERLWYAYSGQIARLPEVSATLAVRDLSALGIVRGLDRETFPSAVKAALLGQPLIAKIDDFVRYPRRFGEVRNLIAQIADLDLARRDAAEAWQTTMRWLLNFLPERYEYRRPQHSEVFCRRLNPQPRLS